jgi:hypothetical protein
MKLINLFTWVTNLVEAFTFYGGGGDGGGSSGHQTSTSYSTNLPEYAQPYYQELMKQTGKQVYSTDSKGNVIGVQPMPTYTGQRVAGFTPEQLRVQSDVAGMTRPGGFGAATTGLGVGQQMGFGAGATGLNQAFGYRPENISAQNISMPNLQNYRMNAAQSNYNPNLINYQMNPAQNVNARDVGTQNFSRGAANYYMSPYIQAAINPALREARLQGDLQKQAGALGSIGRGTFGGARQALLQAEQERGTQRNIADIQATGMEKAYQNAQAQFQADQARQLQAQQANQQYGLQAQLANQQTRQAAAQANLQAKLGVQQLDTETGRQMAIANLTNAQQANVQNLAAQLQTQGLSAEQAMKAALANQQSNLQAQQLTQQGRQFGAGLGKDIGLAGITTGIEASAKQAAASAAQQTSDLERLKAQAATGAEKQALQQKIDDLKYQTFMDQQNYQKQQLEYLSNILRGNAAALGSSQVQYTPQPSTISQIGGLGLAGLGLAKALG